MCLINLLRGFTRSLFLQSPLVTHSLPSQLILLLPSSFSCRLWTCWESHHPKTIDSSVDTKMEVTSSFSSLLLPYNSLLRNCSICEILVLSTLITLDCKSMVTLLLQCAISVLWYRHSCRHWEDYFSKTHGQYCSSLGDPFKTGSRWRIDRNLSLGFIHNSRVFLFFVF